MTAVVLVLGDVGRSPRTCYAAHSLSAGFDRVVLVGYEGTPVSDAVASVVDISAFPCASSASWLLSLPRKLVVNTVRCLYLLCVYRPDTLWVQSPPAFPTLAICGIARLCGVYVVCDVHNLGFTLLGPRTNNSCIVALAKYVELAGLAHCADAIVVVSDAMKVYLKQHNIHNITVFHDAPFEGFYACTDDKAHFAAASKALRLRLFGDTPRVVVSSTSWSYDEDFDLLLHAIKHYDRLSEIPTIFAISGKGPMREEFETACSKLALSPLTSIRTLWLEHSEYPLFLYGADAGISLHGSSSGLDLPMKVVDMALGSHLPVVSMDFPCLGELLPDGLGFRVTSAEEMARALLDVESLEAARSRLSESAETFGERFQRLHMNELARGPSSARWAYIAVIAIGMYMAWWCAIIEQ